MNNILYVVSIGLKLKMLEISKKIDDEVIIKNQLVY